MLAAKRDLKRRREVTFSDLTLQEEHQLYTCDEYFSNDEAEKSFVVAGKELTAKLLAEALHSLPDEKREAVLLYYFFDMSDVEIAKLLSIPKSTVQYRRTSFLICQIEFQNKIKNPPSQCDWRTSQCDWRTSTRKFHIYLV